MIHEIVQIQKPDTLQIDPRNLDCLQFQVIAPKILVHEIVIVIQNSIAIELHHIQDTLKFITNEGILDLHKTLFYSEKTLEFFKPTLEIDSTLEIIVLRIDLHKNHVLDLRLHLGDLSKIYNQILLKNLTTTLKAFQSRWTKLKLTCIPLKRQVLQIQPARFLICIFFLKTKFIQNHLRD